MRRDTPPMGGANSKYEALVYIKYESAFETKAEIAKYDKSVVEYEVLLADAQLLFDETEKEMKADIAFFDDLTKMRLEKYKEWMIRKAQYGEELDGISEALKILTSDETRELFAKSIKPGKDDPPKHEQEAPLNEYTIDVLKEA